MGDHDNTVPLADDTADTLAPGDRVGDYEIVRALGKGSYGAVYEALKHPIRKRTALKVLHRQLKHRRDVVERFVREAGVVAGLEHPHIVQVFDVGVHDGVPFLAMEMLEGETLHARLEREGRLACGVAVDLLLCVFSAVATAHARGVIHRDLKPDNIFLARMPAGPDQARLLDFGVAKVLETDVALTRSHALIGTPLYMSPEQAREARDITEASDQWSLAVILYRCVTGALPFHAKSLMALLNTITHDVPVPAHERGPDVPEGVGEAIARALHKAPDQRYRSVRAFGAALLPYASAAARAHWEDYFASHAEAAVDVYRPTLPGGPPPAPAAIPEAPPAIAAETLAPSTLAPHERVTLWRGRAFATLGLVAGLGATAVLWPTPPPSSTPVHGAPVTAVPHAIRSSSPPPPRVEPADAPTAMPTTIVAGDVPASAPTRVHGARIRHPAHAPRGDGATPAAGPSGPAPAVVRTDCPNGICTVE